MQLDRDPSRLLPPGFDQEDQLSRSSNQVLNDSSLYHEDTHTEKTVYVAKQEQYNAIFEDSLNTSNLASNFNAKMKLNTSISTLNVSQAEMMLSKIEKNNSMLGCESD